MATVRELNSPVPTATNYLMTKRTGRLKQKPQEPSKAISDILKKGDRSEVRALFAFSSVSTEAQLLLKFNVWSRWFFPQYFKAADAPFHRDIDRYNLAVYSGKPTLNLDGILSTIRYFVDIIFRGGAKTTRTKLFVAFAIANDTDHTRKYIKVLTKETSNSKQIVTDVFNMLVNQRVSHYYPELFKDTVEKREETMASFTTATGVKMRAGTVGTDQRGQLQEDARPDFVWFDDFETRKTLRSAVETQSIWDNMEEARTGLSKDGGAIYTCNYLSERGNVHRLVEKTGDDRLVLVVPIRFNGQPMWSAYTIGDIDNIERNADDFAGEYLCEPSAGPDILFDRATLDRQVTIQPKRVVGGLKIFYEYNASHRYGSGHDVAGGVGLDSSTSVIWDFSTTPSRVVATYKDNTIKPDTFGHEISNQAYRYGAPKVAVENNKFDMCIGVLKRKPDIDLFFTDVDETIVGMPPRRRYYGWNTNTDTKPKMILDLKQAVEDGHAQLTDEALKAELRSYTRDDLMDGEVDVRLTTRHFDLLMAAAIGYQMRHHALVKKEADGGYQQPDYERSGIES